MTRRRLLIAAAALCALARLGDSTGFAQQTPTVVVQLLAINDFHGHLEPPEGTNGRIGGTSAGGSEYLATHLARAVARRAQEKKARDGAEADE